MLPLKPGQQLKVRYIERGTTVAGTLEEVGESELTITLEEVMALEPGDEVVLEVDQGKDAPCLLQACLKGVGPGYTCTLRLLGEPSPLERRRYPRLPTNFRARYFLRQKRPGEPKCLQGEIRDISNGGALLVTEEFLTLERELMLVFDLPMGKRKTCTTGIGGRVVREQDRGIPEKHSYGIEFSRHLALSGLRG